MEAPKRESEHVEAAKEALSLPTHDDMEGLSLWETVTESPKAIAYCCCMSLGPFVFGFDNIIIGLVTGMPAFQVSFGDFDGSDYVIPANWLSLWTALVSIGVMGGSLLAGFLCERFGTRSATILGGIVGVGGALTCAFANLCALLNAKRVTFLMGKIIIGLGLGLMMPASQTYVSEVAPRKLRGALLSSFTLFMVVGQVIAVSSIFSRISIIDSFSYRLLFAAEAIPTGAAALFALASPESPNYYTKRGKRSRAISAYSRLFSREKADSAIDRIEIDLKHEESRQAAAGTPSYQECFQGSNWRRTRIVLYANMLQSFVGIAMISNSTYFLELGGMSAHSALSVTTCSLCLMILAILISWYMMAFLGRRTILLWSTGMIGIFWIAIGIAGCISSSEAFWAVGCLMVVVNFIYALGVGSVYPVVSSETSTLRLRGKTQGIAFFVQFVVSLAFQYAVPYMYSTADGDMGGKVGFVFGGLSVISVAVLFFELPEMKDRTVEQLDRLFEQRAPTLAFRTSEL